MNWSKTRARIAFPAFIIVILIGVILYREPLSQFLGSEEAVERLLDESGLLGMAAIVGLQVFQVIVFVVPGEVVQIAAGYLYGVWWGTVLSVAGILIGSSFNFWVGRALGGPFVRAVVKAETLERINSVTAKRGTRVGFFLLFVIPGIPKDILCYAGGASADIGAGEEDHISFSSFLLFSMVGRLPGIVGSALIGASTAEGQVVLAAVILTVAAVLLVAGVTGQKKLERLLLWIGSRWFGSRRS